MFVNVALTLTVCLAAAASAAPADEAGHQRMVKLAHSVDVFGLNLLAHLERAEPRTDEPKNVLISPLSISSVLTTLLAGSAQQTNHQIHRTLGYEHEHFGEKEALENFRHLRARLNEQLRKTKNILEVADAVAVQKNYPVLESFYKDLDGEEIMTKNFRSEAHKSTEEINKWVKEKTHDKITKLFGQDLNPETAMVLLNAVFFKGIWKRPFNHTLTKREPFNYFGKGGIKRSEQVEMMNIRGAFGHAHFEDGDLLEMPFVNDSTVLLAFLPSEKHSADLSISALFGASEEGVDSMKFADRLAHVRPHREVKVHLPKFKIESKYSLNAALKHLGVRDAFEQGHADFSRINGKRDLVVSDVAHKAFFEVNEEGAEAAAATGVVIVPTSVQMPVTFNANRPFLFMIYDKTEQLVLFIGVVNKP